MKKILIINLGGIGDILLSFPALKALRAFYPQAEIYGLFPWKLSGFAGELLYFNKVYTLNVGLGGQSLFNSIMYNFKTLLLLRKEHFDIAINMRTIVSEKGAKKLKFILNVIDPKIKVGRDTDGRGYFFDIKIPETLIGEKYEMEYDIDTVKALGINVLDREIDFMPAENSLNKINDILKKEGILRADVIIGLHPGGKFSHRWPKENFIKMMEIICRDKPCSFVITGGQDERGLADEIINRSKLKIVNFAGRINIKEFTGLIKRCSLFISNDTGPMHIAAVSKIPLIAIFGPGYLVRYDPRSISEETVVLYKKAECAPCDDTVCASLKCLKAITPEEVAAAAKLLLTGRK